MMVNQNISVPQDLNIDLNTYMSKYTDIDNGSDNPLNLMNIN